MTSGADVPGVDPGPPAAVVEAPPVTVIVSPPTRTTETRPVPESDGSAPPLSVSVLPEIDVIVRVPLTPEICTTWPTVKLDASEADGLPIDTVVDVELSVPLTWPRLE